MSDNPMMSVGSHLIELRMRLRNIALIILAVTIACFLVKNQILVWLATPYYQACTLIKSAQCELSNLGMMEGFVVLIKGALLAALFMASPFVFYQLWKFIAPALKLREKRWLIPGIFLAAVLFIVGGLFCYRYVLPASCEFFLRASSGVAQLIAEAFPHGTIKNQISLDDYFGFAWMMIVLFGAVFELPLLLSILGIAGIVSPRGLWRFNRYAVLIFAILGAVVTPGDLVVGQLMMTLALAVLYNMSIGIVWCAKRFSSKEDNTTI